jgi:hypothetical protein
VTTTARPRVIRSINFSFLQSPSLVPISTSPRLSSQHQALFANHPLPRSQQGQTPLHRRCAGWASPVVVNVR